jgi:hypothetical protein
VPSRSPEQQQKLPQTYLWDAVCAGGCSCCHVRLDGANATLLLLLLQATTLLLNRLLLSSFGLPSQKLASLVWQQPQKLASLLSQACSLCSALQWPQVHFSLLGPLMLRLTGEDILIGAWPSGVCHQLLLAAKYLHIELATCTTRKACCRSSSKEFLKEAASLSGTPNNDGFIWGYWIQVTIKRTTSEY